MNIILLRHGKPQVETALRLTPAELADWVANYNGAAIDPLHAPSKTAMQLAEASRFVVCSDLRRSRESAHMLGIERIDVCEAAFRELELPYTRWHFPRLPLLTWAVLFRLLWLLGFSVNGESLTSSRRRARQCAEQLAAWAASHGTVLFVGHGSLNWFIARHLRKMGWSGPARSPRSYWEFAVYHHEAK
ncbi:MAG TPA: histidine phosphatase family protein [Gammaproteobacteria bacterium]